MKLAFDSQLNLYERRNLFSYDQNFPYFEETLNVA